jgi:hypothetical protein
LTDLIDRQTSLINEISFIWTVNKIIFEITVLFLIEFFWSHHFQRSPQILFSLPLPLSQLLCYWLILFSHLDLEKLLFCPLMIQWYHHQVWDHILSIFYTLSQSFRPFLSTKYIEAEDGAISLAELGRNSTLL